MDQKFYTFAWQALVLEPGATEPTRKDGRTTLKDQSPQHVLARIVDEELPAVVQEFTARFLYESP